MPSAAVATPLALPRTRRGEITRERILDAAEALFAQHGYDGTTLRDVAQRVGLRIPSLYNHFASKESLYAAVLDRGVGPVLALLSEFVEAGRSGRTDSGELVGRVMELLARRPQLPRLVQHETLSGGQRLTPMLRGWIVPVFAKAHEMTEAHADEWSRDQIPLLVLAMYHVMVGYFTIAPLYKDLNGQDLLTRQALEQQTRFFTRLVDSVFPDRTRSQNG